jgi:hypothetical protein
MAKKGLIPWILLAAGLFAAGYLWAAERGRVKLAEERVKAKEQEVVAAKAETKRAEDLAARTEAAIAEHDAKAAAREAWLIERIERVNTATPQQLVDEGSRILEATDITTDGKAVTMGVETWRRAVKVFTSEEGYRLTKEPDWQQKLALRDQEIGELKIGSLAKDRTIAGVEAINKELKDLVGKQKSVKLFEKMAWAAAGYALGSLTEKIR